MPKIAIIGAGISGLSTAYYLEKAGFSDLTIFEKSGTVGGVLKTDFVNESLIEQAAESIAKFPPTIFELIDEIGLANDIIEPLTTKFQLYVNGKMLEPPAGLRYMIPTNLDAFIGSDFFSTTAKQRILKEAEIKPIESDNALTLKDFVIYRFGEEMYQRYAAPVYGGIFGFDAGQLNLQTIMPQLPKWEKQYGSITKAVENLPAKSNSGAVYFSFKNGVQSFVKAIQKQLTKSKIYLNQPVKSISQKNEQWLLNDELFDKVIISTNATIAASILKKENTQLANLLKQVHFKSAGILTFLYDDILKEIDKYSSGILLPVEKFPQFSAITFSSNKWADRCRPNEQLLRMYVRDQNLIHQPKEMVAQKGRQVLQQLLKINKSPLSSFLHLWPGSRPLYTIEHQNTVDEIKSELKNTPNLHLCGCSYNGSGIASLVHQSKLLANNIAG